MLDPFFLKRDYLDVSEIKTIVIDLKKLSDGMKNEVVKYAKFITLKMKINKLDKKIPDATTLFPINQLNTKKQTKKQIAEAKTNTYF